MTAEIDTIISGGQTGADRAALDFAICCGLNYGGWVPKGRTDELGVIPLCYSKLIDAGYEDSSIRTEWNVWDSDGTVIFSHGPLTGGSKLTAESAVKLGKPWLHVDLENLSELSAAEEFSKWIRKHNIRTLNVAGPRQSEDANIYRDTLKMLELAILRE